jgi:2-amino-4-hydroxy-6-hydroxymethyldihydropteridine diphosphokinase
MAPAGDPLPAPVGAWRAHIGLGANLGDTWATLDAAERALRALPGCRWVAASRRYRSAPVGTTGPDFLNAVVALDVWPDPAPERAADPVPPPLTAARRLLHALQAIELAHGRERPHRWAPRTLDLDLLLFGDLVCDTPELTLPHPRLAQRAFVVRPLLELAPALVVPGVGPLAAALGALADQALEALDPPA